MPNANIEFDENGVRYQIKDILGRGGQGATFLTNDNGILIKKAFISSDGRTPDECYRDYRRSIDEVRSLPITPDMHIAAPVYMLNKPHCGYVMQLMRDMTDLNGLIYSFDQTPSEDKPKQYQSTGGLLRRLKLLRGLSEILCKLRENNLVYVDLSPANVFISKDLEYSQVWLIDADNIRYNGQVTRSFGTPEFRAPEVACGNHNSMYSDIFSFALLAHILLTGDKPFIGNLCFKNIAYTDEPNQQNTKAELIEDDWDTDEPDTPPEDESPDNSNDTSEENDPYFLKRPALHPGSDVFERAEKGFIPWIDDPDNRINANEHIGLRRAAISPRLFDCFNRTFSREGRTRPLSRPAPRDWLKAVNSAIDITISCECGWTFYADTPVCPLCGKRNENVWHAVIREAVFERTDAGKMVLFDKRHVRSCAFKEGENLILTADHIQPTAESCCQDSNNEYLRVHIEKGQLELTTEDELPCGAVALLNGQKYDLKPSARYTESPEAVRLIVPSRIGPEKIRIVTFKKL